VISGSKILAVACIEVVPKQLSISGTWVDTVKFFDNTLHTYVAAGQLFGVLSQDVDEVFVTAGARYENLWPGYNKRIAVDYALSGARSSCYVAPKSDTVRGSISKDSSGVCDVWGVMLKQEVEKGGAIRYVPWRSATIKYSVNGSPWYEQAVDNNGRYFLSGLDYGVTVQLETVRKQGYMHTPTYQEITVDQNVVQADTILYTPDGISMLTLSLIDDSNNELVRWEQEQINDTTYYKVPCSENAATQRLSLRYTIPVGVIDKIIDVNDIGRGGEVRESEIGTFMVDMKNSGRKTLTIELHNSVTNATKRYTIVLEKQFELFEIIREHMGSLRVVHNNPELNTSGLQFSTCEWRRRKSAGKWFIGEPRLLYYAAGPSINEQFENDSMYLVLYTTTGYRLETCPGGADVEAEAEATAYAKDSAGVSGGKKSVSLSVYPNPVASGGTIRLKQLELLDSEDGLYATLYLFDAQGRLILTGSASTLRDGLIMPETPGIYHLILEGKTDRKVVKIAVGQKE
jgi:hypothetical protein